MRESQSGFYEDGQWQRNQITDLDAEIEKLERWLDVHKPPRGLVGPSSNGYDLFHATDEISFASYAYRDYRSGKVDAFRDRLALLGWVIWVVTNASHRWSGYRSIYLRQMAKLGGTICHVMTLRQQLEHLEKEKLEDVERERRQSIQSPWKDAECEGCRAKKRTWADMTKWMCVRCGTPLGHFPRP